MQLRTLGRTAIKVSEISFGTVALGMPYGIGAKDESSLMPESQAIKLLRQALEAGINFFDTARSYGSSEYLLGQAFNSVRESVVIATKTAHIKDKQGNIPSASDIKKMIEKSLDESLSALQSDYIDIYMLHDPDIEIFTNDTVINTMTEIKNKGKAKALGVSTYTPEQTRKVIETNAYDVIQLPYNLMDQRQGNLFPLAYQKGIGIVVRSVLFKGILTDRGEQLHPALESVKKHRKVYESLLNEQAPTLAVLATKFVLSHKEISSVLVGIDKTEYLEDALAVADGNYLDSATLEQAKQLAYPDPDFLDLTKWSKMGWLK